MPDPGQSRPDRHGQPPCRACRRGVHGADLRPGPPAHRHAASAGGQLHPDAAVSGADQRPEAAFQTSLADHCPGENT